MENKRESSEVKANRSTALSEACDKHVAAAGCTALPPIHADRVFKSITTKQ